MASTAASQSAAADSSQDAVSPIAPEQSSADPDASDVAGTGPEDRGGGVMLDTLPLMTAGVAGQASSAPASDVAPRAAPVSPTSQFYPPARPRQGSGKANMRLFLEKMQRRRKRISCSHACWKALRDKLLQIADESGHVHYQVLRETLRQAPKGAASADFNVWKDLVEVARAYDCTGNNSVEVSELLHSALDVQPVISARGLLVLQVAAMLLWFILAPLVYCAIGGWSALDALYFAVMLISTVGSNSLMPVPFGLKIFTIFYMLSGILLLAWFVVTAIAHMVLTYEAKVRSLYFRADADLFAEDGHGSAKGGPSLEDLLTLAAADAKGLRAPISRAVAIPPNKIEAASRQGERAAAVVLASMQKDVHAHFMRATECAVVMAALLFSGACLYYVSAESTDAPMTDAFYWAVATCSTIGTRLELGGDNVTLGRALKLVFVFIAVPGCAFGFFEMGVAYVELCSAKLATEISSRVLTPDVLLDLDNNGSGIGRVEFLCAALMALDKVSAKDLWHVLYMFEALDVDRSGFLDRQELAALRRSLKPGTLRAAAPNSSGVLGCLCCRRRSKESSSMGAAATPQPKVLGGTEDIERALPGSLSGTTSASQTVPLALDISAAAVGAWPSSPAEELEGARRQLIEKSEQLLAKDSFRQQLEQALRQAQTERQALHGEVRLLRHVASEAQGRAEDDRRRLEEGELQRADAGRRVQEAEQRAQEAMRRCREAEQSCFEAQRQAREAEQARADADLRARQAIERAEVAERREADIAQKMRDAEGEWRLQMETKARDLEFKSAEVDMRRQGEIRAALLELQALAQGQQALRTQMHRTQPPPALTFLGSRSGSPVGLASKVRSWGEPWEVYHVPDMGRDSANWRSGLQASSSSSALLSGKVREQAEFLEQSVRDLESRNLSGEQSTLPGLM